jgi:hypothetical protein
MMFKGQLFALLVSLGAIHAQDAAAADAGAEGAERCIVALASPSLVEADAQAPGALERLPGGRIDFRGAKVRHHLIALQEEHAAFADALAAEHEGAVVERFFGVLYNGAVVRGLAAEEARGLPGVVGAVPADAVRVGMESGDPLDAVDVEVLWDAAGGAGSAGEGIRIAIVDSGIDAANALFDPSGLEMPAGFPRGDIALTTSKVIAARAYFREEDPVDAAIDTADAADHLGHGSRCAGAAAGASGIAFDLDGTALEVGGAAPRAFLMSYKVLYAAESGETFASDAELMAAFEDAVLDGADVIVGAWGGPAPLLSDTPCEIAIRAASSAGAIVVAAAGNAGGGPGTTAFPGTIPEALTIGSFSTGRAFAGIAAIVGPEPVPAALREMPAVRGSISPAFADAPLGPTALVSARAVDGGASALGCEPFSSLAFDGAVALIPRGECTFSTKVENAADAGAVAVVVYNDDPGAQPITMGGNAVSIPAVQIGNPDGAMLEEFLSHHAGCEISLVDTLAPYARPAEAWAVPAQSSRGPTDGPALKPEIAAPGEAIVSAAAYPVGSEGPPWSIGSGTSLAASFAAGAAAVLRQIHPELEPDEVKGALVSGASDERAASAGAAILDRGAGYLDLSNAQGPLLYAVPSAISLGEAHAGESLVAQLEIRADAPCPPLTVSWVHGDPLHAPIAAPSDGEEIVPGEAFEVEVEIPLATPGGEYTGYLAADLGAGPDRRALRVPYHYRVLSPVRHDLLLVDLAFLPDQQDGLDEVYRGLAEGAGLDADLFRVDAENGAPPLALLEGYDAVLVFTGDDQTAHLGALGTRTLDAVSTFAAKGGGVIVAGQGALRGGVHARLFGLLGSRIANTYPLFDPYTVEPVALADYVVRIAPDLFPTGGAPAGAAVDLDPAGGGSGRLELVGEIDAVDGPGLTTSLTRPALFMDDAVFEGGVGALGAVFDPYAAYGAFPEVEALAQRAALLGFGFERIADGGGAAPLDALGLFEALYAWVVARIDLAVEVETVDLHAIVDAQTSGGDLAQYVYDFGDGSEPLVTDAPRAYWEYAEAGDYEIAVIARSTLGAADVERIEISVPEEEPPSTDTGTDTSDDDRPGVDGVAASRGTRDCGCRAVGAPRARSGSVLSSLLGEGAR